MVPPPPHSAAAPNSFKQFSTHARTHKYTRTHSQPDSQAGRQTHRPPHTPPPPPPHTHTRTHHTHTCRSGGVIPARFGDVLQNDVARAGSDVRRDVRRRLHIAVRKIGRWDAARREQLKVRGVDGRPDAAVAATVQPNQPISIIHWPIIIYSNQ